MLPEKFWFFGFFFIESISKNVFSAETIIGSLTEECEWKKIFPFEY